MKPAVAFLALIQPCCCSEILAAEANAGGDDDDDDDDGDGGQKMFPNDIMDVQTMAATSKAITQQHAVGVVHEGVFFFVFFFCRVLCICVCASA